MHAVEAPAIDPVRDRPAPEPEFEQLRPSDYAMLARSQLGKGQLPLTPSWVKSCIRSMLDSAHAPSVACSGAQVA